MSAASPLAAACMPVCLLHACKPHHSSHVLHSSVAFQCCIVTLAFAFLQPPCRVHALNCLRMAFQDANLTMDTSAFLAAGMQTAIRGMAAKLWEVSAAMLTVAAGLKSPLKAPVDSAAVAPASCAATCQVEPHFLTPRSALLGCATLQVRNAATLCYTALLVRVLGFRNHAGKVGAGSAAGLPCWQLRFG